MQEINVIFDREITLRGEIRAAQDNAWLSGVQAQVEGRVLKITLPAALEANEAITLVIPRGSIAAAEDESVINNYNSIFGFITE